jgi:hypothetical protein
MSRKPRSGRRVGLPWLLSLSLCLFASKSQAAPDQGPIYISNLTIELEPGKRIKGSLLIEAGVIKGVGDVRAPKNARVISGQGLVAYAGFIDAWTHLGFATAKPAEDKRSDRESQAPDLQANPPISMPQARRKGLRPSYLSAPNYIPPKEAAEHRKAGFTTALVAPKNGYLSGVSAVVQLRDGKRRELVFKAQVAAHASFFSGGGKGYPSTAMGVMSHLRQFFADAQYHRHCRDAFKRANAGLPRPLYDPDLEFVDRLIGKSASSRIPVFFSAAKENEILRAVSLSEEFGFTIVLTGANQAYRHSKMLKNKKILIIGTVDWAKEPKMPARLAKKRKKGPVKKKKRVQGPFSAQTALGIIPPTAAVAQDSKDKVNLKELDALLEESPRVYQSRMKQWKKEVQNLAQLYKSGHRFAVSSRGLRSPTEVLGRLRTLIKNGLPEQAAVAALTTVPAKLLGLNKHAGVIQVGRLANITILSARLSKKDARPRYVIVDGILHEYKAAKKAAPQGAKKKARSQPRKVPARGANLSGQWSIDIGSGRLKGTLTLTQTGQDLKGQIETPMGIAKLTGFVKGRTFKFTATADIQDQKVELKATGSIKGNTLSGTISSPMGQDTVWTAKREPKHFHDSNHNAPLSGCSCMASGRGQQGQKRDDR